MEIKTQALICPNCGKRLDGILDEHGGVRLGCDRCGVLIYSRKVTPIKIKIDVMLPRYN